MVEEKKLTKSSLIGRKSRILVLGALAILATSAIVVSGCKDSKTKQGPSNNKSQLKGTVSSDGSSTVFPITEAVGEEFQIENPKVRVTVGLSGTGGGFKKFAAAEIDISNASRTIKPDEAELAKNNNVKYEEFSVAYDGLSILVNPSNNFAKNITVEELKKIWEPKSKVKTWKDVRSDWPDRKIHLYGPGTDSGTFDYFTKEIVGEEKASRADYTASEDDNVLVQGIAGDKDSLGYFGFAYFEENKDKLKLVPVDSGDGPVAPSRETILDGTYKPLSRPLYIYVNLKSLKRPEVESFIKFYLENGAVLAEQVGYIPLPEKEYTDQLKKL